MTNREILEIAMAQSAEDIGCETADFLKQEWTTDFYLRFRDGTVGIREIVQQTALQKRAEVEKLELSRRYWAVLGVVDWKVVVLGK